MIVKRKHEYGIEILGVSERMSIASLGKNNIDMPVAGFLHRKFNCYSG